MLAQYTLRADRAKRGIFMNWVVVVTVLALFEYTWLTMQCARARALFGVRAPAVTGHHMFERYYRVQQNTLEQLLAFIPALWLFAGYVSPEWSAVLGAVFIVGRALYARDYVTNPRSRGPGFGLSAGATLVLLTGAFVGVLVQIAR